MRVVTEVMRIVAGSLGGRVLRAPPGVGTRPTSEKVREAVFNILGRPGPDDAVLDVFAGSGALGLEALSRGAGRAVFVEKARPAAAVLRRNVDDLGVADRSEIVISDALSYLARAPRAPWRWVFVDPPYRTELAARVLAHFAAHPAELAEDSSIVVEHDRRNPPPEISGSMVRTDLRRYGDTEVSFYRREPAP
jgi:16S rRNA (guanine(966)-N(2))-methyltransferase RsmD